MIIAQVCLRLATIKGHYKFYCIGGSENQSASGVTTICLTQCNTSPSHRVDQVVDCGLWNVGPLLFNGCAKLLDIGKYWNTLLYTPIQSIPNMLNGWHVRWVCWPCKNGDVFSLQELCTDPCNMGPCIRGLHWVWAPVAPNANLTGAGCFTFAAGGSGRSENFARDPRGTVGFDV